MIIFRKNRVNAHLQFCKITQLFKDKFNKRKSHLLMSHQTCRIATWRRHRCRWVKVKTNLSWSTIWNRRIVSNPTCIWVHPKTQRPIKSLRETTSRPRTWIKQSKAKYKDQSEVQWKAMPMESRQNKRRLSHILSHTRTMKLISNKW